MNRVLVLSENSKLFFLTLYGRIFRQPLMLNISQFSIKIYFSFYFLVIPWNDFKYVRNQETLQESSMKWRFNELFFLWVFTAIYVYFLIFLKHQLVNISVTHSSLHALVIVSGENQAVYCVLVGLGTEYRFLIPCSIYLYCILDKRRPIAKELTKYIHIHAVLFFLSLGKH